jgi:ribonuclease HI
MKKTHKTIKTMSSFYAVANGRTNGIFTNWNDCNASVKGFPNAKFKKFPTQDQADEFICLHKQAKIPIEPTQTFASFSPITPEMIHYNDNDSQPFTPDYYVYTDGACSNNGRENAVAGIGIFFGINDSRNVSHRITGKQTNNTAELLAIAGAFDIICDDIRAGKKISIVSDSEYAIKCLTTYGDRCSESDWKLNIPNKDLVKLVYNLYKGLQNVQFLHIRAHTNNTDIHSFGNYNADKLAKIATLS